MGGFVAEVVSSRKVRTITIQVRDKAGGPASGARVSFGIDGADFGSAAVSGTGKVTFQMSGAATTIHVFADFVGDAQQVALPPGEDIYTFHFDKTNLFMSDSVPEARCPDGTTGQPCVNCDIGGTTVRICA